MPEPTKTPDEYLLECVTLDEFAIQEEFCRVAKDYSYWNGRYAQHYREHLHAKIDREVLASQLAGQIRVSLESQRTTGRVTVAEVEAAIASDPSYVDARMREADADSERERLRGVLEAVRSKRDMLVSLGATLRAELQGDPSLRSPG